MTSTLQQMLEKNKEEIAEARRKNAEIWERTRRESHIKAATEACHERYDFERWYPDGSKEKVSGLCRRNDQPCSPERCFE